MNFVALKMLVADRAKYFSLIFAIAFASFLLANQVSIFIGIMTRPSSQIQDVVDADIWVMDPQTLYSNEVYALRDYDLYRVRSAPGVEWAVPLYKGNGRAKGPDGRFRTVILMGLDDATLVGAPRKMLVGSIQDLDQPDAAIIDKAGYLYFFPGQPLEVGKTLQMNERRVLIVGISDASAPFESFPVLHTRYSQDAQEQGRRDRLNEAAQQSQLAVDLATEQYKAGLADFLSVLDAQRELYAEEDQAVQSQTSVTTNVIALYRALGGGWNVGPVVAATKPTP